MRNSFALVLLFAAIGTSPAVMAQDGPKLELYAGYDYTRFNINANVSGQPPSQTFNGNGGGGQLVYNVNNRLGVLGDVGGYWATNSTKQGAIIPYLFGPRANLHRGDYAICSSSCGRRGDQLWNRENRLAKPFRHDGWWGN